MHFYVKTTVLILKIAEGQIICFDQVWMQIDYYNILIHKN